MLSRKIKGILADSRKQGWVLEPEAKYILQQAGLEVPQFLWAHDLEAALAGAASIGYPVVAKIVSPRIVHKTEQNGVVTGIGDENELTAVFSRLEKLEGFSGVLVEETVGGVELILGVKNDFQFGQTILLGKGGVLTEIYKDTQMRMAPLTRKDAASMIAGLKAAPLLTGYRGSEPVNLLALEETLLAFSELAMELGDRITSMDLNPVFCSREKCTVADARIMLGPD